MKPTNLGIVLLVCFLAAGAAVSRDFPINWDEWHNRDNGVASLQHARDYLTTGAAPPRVDMRSEHGTAYEMALVLLERAVGLDYQERPLAVHLLRHRLTFFVFALAVLALGLLVGTHLRQPWLGVAAGALLATHPRLFHHAFHNTSDIGFLAVMTWAHLTLLWLLRRPTWGRALLHGLVCAVAIDIRIPAIYLVVVSLVCVGVSAGAPLKRRLAVGGAYLASTVVLAIALWPQLWGAPVDNFVWAVRSMSRINWPMTVRYGGQEVASDALPWHYNLVWIAVTSPLLVVGLGALGFATGAARLLRAPWRFVREQPLTLALGAWLAVPLVAPMVLGSVLFDGWRHHYFVYPALVAFAAQAAGDLHRWLSARRPVLRWVVGPALAVTVAISVGQLVTLHPHQALYFNALGDRVAGQGVDHRLEVDYWGLAQREGLEAVARLERDTTGPIRILQRVALDPDLLDRPGILRRVTNMSLRHNQMWLPPEIRQRIRLVNRLEQADYFFGTYRWWMGEYWPHFFGPEVSSVAVQGRKVLSVRRVRDVR